MTVMLHQSLTGMRSFDSELSAFDVESFPQPMVVAGTSLLDVVLMQGGKPARHIVVTDPSGSLLGVVSWGDLQHEQDESRRQSTDDWQQRPIETLLRARLQPFNSLSAEWSPRAQFDGSSTPCRALVEDGRFVGLMTDNDVLVSWQRIESLISAATIDQLSGLLNRAAFIRRLKEELDRSIRTGSPCVLVLLDLDHFKLVNDTCGHLVGDEIIHEIAGGLMRQSRTYDVIGRLGGDEFAALFCQCTAADVAAPIRRIQAEIHQIVAPARFPHPHLSMSIGAAAVQGQEPVLTTALQQAADECLYAAKHAGRDCAFVTTLGEPGRKKVMTAGEA